MENVLYDCVPEPWKNYFKKEDLDKVYNDIFDDDFLPNKENVFNSLKYFKPNETRVVIIGQDPYHDGNALGYAFGIPVNSSKVNPSLRNIFIEIEKAFNIVHTDVSLESWLRQNVLLYNKSLTVIKGSPNSHKKYWSKVTNKFINKLSTKNKNIVFMLWGNEAKNLGLYINNYNNHLVLESSHPSPFSVNFGKEPFYGSKHFLICNQYLKDNNYKEIVW